jgi:molecular chaperone DnaJ
VVAGAALLRVNRSATDSVSGQPRLWKKKLVPEAARDYYQVLGIAPEADAAAIKQAFRSSARRLHPDVSADPDAEEKFRTIADAYAVLSKPASRLLYDRFGYRGRGVWAESPAAAQAFTGLFEYWARSRRRPRQSGDLAELELEFYEAARGGRRTVSYRSRGPCDSCGGSGAFGGGPAQPCAACSGRGHLRETDDSGGVRLLQLVKCEECEGTGRVVASACRECEGSGEREGERRVEVPIPSGVADGARLPLEDDPDGPHVVVRVKPQPPDSTVVRVAAAAGLATAVGFLVFLLIG